MKHFMMILFLVAPTPLWASDFNLEVVHADKVTRFEVGKDKTGPYFKAKNNQGRKTESRLTPKNYAYLKKEAEEIAQISSAGKGVCPRYTVTLKADSTEYTDCLTAKNTRAQRMKKLANALGLLF